MDVGVRGFVSGGRVESGWGLGLDLGDDGLVMGSGWMDGWCGKDAQGNLEVQCSAWCGV
jgi:hypothetical protein